MKKTWVNPAIETLEVGFTAHDTVKGQGGDGWVWVTQNDGSGGWDFPDIGDRWTTAAS